MSVSRQLLCAALLWAPCIVLHRRHEHIRALRVRIHAADCEKIRLIDDECCFTLRNERYSCSALNCRAAGRHVVTCTLSRVGSWLASVLFV